MSLRRNVTVKAPHAVDAHWSGRALLLELVAVVAYIGELGRERGGFSCLGVGAFGYPLERSL